MEWTLSRPGFPQHALVHIRVGDGGRTAVGSSPGPMFSAGFVSVLGIQNPTAAVKRYNAHTWSPRHILVSSKRVKNRKGKVKRKARV